MKDIKSLIAPNFYELHKDIQAHRHSTYLLGGGRGSLKTSTIVTEVLLLMQKHRELCAAVFMKQTSRIRRGSFAAYTEGITRAGLDDVYKIKLSPPTIINKETGQTIIFLGLDDPGKTKGISTGSPETYFGIIHFEELDQFSGPRELDVAIDSLIRGGDRSWCFQCYNPPRNAANWVNEFAKKNIPDRLVHFSDYRTVPKQWLGEAFINKVRQCYLVNPAEYEWRYLGKVIGMEGLIFKNIMQWKYCEQQYDMICQGIDLGWADPKVFIRVGIDIPRQNIFILDEFYQSYTRNEIVANWIADRNYTEAVTVLESAGGAEAQSVYTSYGVPTSIVYKARDLKRNALEYLLSRAHICIDPLRTPHAFEEFSQYAWKTDEQGNCLEQTIDINDHTIDAVRYAISPQLNILEAL